MFLLAEKIFENWVCWSMSRISRIKTRSFSCRLPMTLGALEEGTGSDQIARMSGKDGWVGGETRARFPLRNFFGWPGFSTTI